MVLKIDAKFDGKPICASKNENEESSKLSPEHSKYKLGLWWDPFIQSIQSMSLNFAGEFCVMTIKNDVKFEEELTCRFKIEMKNLTNFDSSTRKSQKISL